MTKMFDSSAEGFDVDVKLVEVGVPELGLELLLVGRDGGFCLGDGLFNRLDRVDGLGVDGGDGVGLGHVRVVVSNDVFRRFFLRNDDILSEAETFQT